MNHPIPGGDAALADALARCDALARENDRLRESETRFRLMADATPDVVWMTDTHPERLLYVSPSFERIWGRPVDALYADPRLWTESIHVDDRGAVVRDFGHWLHHGTAQDPWEAAFRVVRPDGDVRWIHERGVAFVRPDGSRWVSGVSTDVTERLQAERALRTSEERFALAVAGSNDGIWDWDILTNHMFMSERAQRIYGLEVGPTVRPRNEWRAAIRLHPDDIESQLDMVESYLLGIGPAYEGEWRMRHPDGSYRWVRIRGLCVRDANGRATRLAGSVSDIDSRKRAEAALRQSQRLEAIGTLAGGIAHDFNNILGAILGFGEMMMRNTRPQSRMRRDFGYVMAAGERGRALVERILAFSGTAVSERVPVGLEGIVREVLDLLSASLPDTIAVDVALSAGTAATLGDATQVHQVVMNLVTNAVQAMPDGGTVRVAVDTCELASDRVLSTGALPAGRYLLLTVADTGVGMPEDVVARIFDPFFTTKDPGVGTGLGLSLVHGIVGEMGGGVDVATSRGAGSTFTVWLPHVGDVGARNAASQRALPRGRQQRILVVDDEAPLVHLATGTLASLGYAPVGFSSSTEALSAFEADPDGFDAVLTDERMPHLSGTALIAAVRARRPDLPVLLVTGDPGGQAARRARDAGADTVLGKPVAARDMARELAALLERGRPDGQASARPTAASSSARS